MVILGHPGAPCPNCCDCGRDVIKGYAQTGWEQNLSRQLPIKGYANIHEQRVAVDEEARHTSVGLGTKCLRFRKFTSGQVRHTTWYLRL